MIAGVDGCRGGWVVARAETSRHDQPPDVFVCPTFVEVLAATAACDIVMVDMPIGLPDGAAPRACDIEAQRMLGTRQSSVFPTPPRSTLVATTPREFQALYRHARGKGAPVPLWGIVPKIREVDAAMTAAVQHRVKEVHPELAWLRRAGSMLPSKKTEAGVAERARVLSWSMGSISRVDDLLRQRPRPAQRDDILDALVALVVAADVADGHARRTCVDEPPCDARGLRMEIWY